MLLSKLLLAFGLTLLLSLGRAAEVNTGNDAAKALDFSPFLQPDSPIPDSFKRAIKIIDEHETVPSCRKMAAATLAHACAFLGSGDHRDKELNLYAARLAVCERLEANAPVPAGCLRFVPNSTNTQKKRILGYVYEHNASHSVPGYPVYDSDTREDLQLCFEGMRNCDQCWTSYSNSRQNAIMSCRAVSGDIEKDEILQTYRGMAEALKETHEGVQRMNQTTHGFAGDMYQQFVNAKQSFSDFFRHFHEKQTEAERLWDEGLGSMRQGMQDAVDGSKAQLHEVKSNINSTGEIAVQAVSNATSRMGALFANHESQLERMSTDVEAAGEKVGYTIEAMEQGFFKAVYNFTNDLELAQAIAKTIGSNLRDLDLAVTRSGEQAAAFDLQMAKLSEDFQQMKGDVGEIGAMANRSKDDVSQLVGSLEVLTPIVSGIVSSFKPLKAIAWYFLLAGLVLGVWSIIKLCPGGTLLLQVPARLAMQLFSSVAGKYVLGLLATCATVILFPNLASLPHIFSSRSFYELSNFQQAGLVSAITLAICLPLAIAWRRFRASNQQDVLDDEELPRMEEKLPMPELRRERRARKWDV